MRLGLHAVAAILVWTTSSANAQDPAPSVSAVRDSIDYGINSIKIAPPTTKFRRTIPTCPNCNKIRLACDPTH